MNAKSQSIKASQGHTRKRAQIIVASCNRRGLEVEQLRDYLSGNEHTVTQNTWDVDPHADLILLSTCGFTKAAEDAGFNKYHEILEKKKPSAKVVFGGCIPEINPDRTLREYGDDTFSPQTYERLNDILKLQRKFEDFQRPNTVTRSALTESVGKAIELFKSFDGSLSGLAFISRRLANGVLRQIIRRNFARIDDQKTFFIQIQEGCSMGCSFCVIPKAIGKLRSKPLAHVLDEFKTGIGRGFTRFQLVGDNAGSYGLDIGTNLGVLLDEIGELRREDGFLLDLTDINPVYMKLIYPAVKRLNDQKILDRLYSPIQSGSQRILKLMKRQCDMDSVKRMQIDIRKHAHTDFKMGTSVIVGFPTETIEEFYETIEYCRDVRFDWVYCHSFSAREGARAAAISGELEPDEILRRARLLKSELAGISLVTTAEDTSGSRTCQG